MMICICFGFVFHYIQSHCDKVFQKNMFHSFCVFTDETEPFHYFCEFNKLTSQQWINFLCRFKFYYYWLVVLNAIEILYKMMTWSSWHISLFWISLLSSLLIIITSNTGKKEVLQQKTYSLIWSIMLFDDDDDGWRCLIWNGNWWYWCLILCWIVWQSNTLQCIYANTTFISFVSIILICLSKIVLCTCPICLYCDLLLAAYVIWQMLNLYTFKSMETFCRGKEKVWAHFFGETKIVEKEVIEMLHRTVAPKNEQNKLLQTIH